MPGIPKAPVPASTPVASRSRRQRVLKEKPETAAPKTLARVSVKESHGLYAFFRRVSGDNLTGEDRYETIETPEAMRIISGRPWESAELRLKSFKDLHTLWYVAAREQNLLATQKEETRRMGVTNPEMQVSLDKVRNCRKTMARIKMVLNERRLAFEGAVKLAGKQRENTNGNEDNTEIIAFMNELTREEDPKTKQFRAQRRNHASGQKVSIPSKETAEEEIFSS
ncbi:mitochondrial 39-S ribosomal protein L47 (MRP-L47)-domain-containing protein [Crepidotus variabilis]|uniref:Large ribosomal subunit protein uL29m n=1 Tax=Crepidotus variabilis TaxID=179855 RepID=A0A9P6JU56_9AGAR|nr:mitochondrial 39-S ribosomal protein L47 (MRP-L47)-domain-containing protein [Crepidotus variabilis]